MTNVQWIEAVVRDATRTTADGIRALPSTTTDAVLCHAIGVDVDDVSVTQVDTLTRGLYGVDSGGPDTPRLNYLCAYLLRHVVYMRARGVVNAVDDATPSVYDAVMHAASYCVGTIDTEQRSHGSTINRLYHIVRGMADDDDIIGTLETAWAAEGIGRVAPSGWVWMDDDGDDVDELDAETADYVEPELVDAINALLPDDVAQYASFGRLADNGNMCVHLLPEYETAETWTTPDKAGLADYRHGVTITADGVSIETTPDDGVADAWVSVSYDSNGLSGYAAWSNAGADDDSYVVPLDDSAWRGVLASTLRDVSATMLTDDAGRPLVGRGHPCWIALSHEHGWLDVDERRPRLCTDDVRNIRAALVLMAERDRDRGVVHDTTATLQRVLQLS